MLIPNSSNQCSHVHSILLSHAPAPKTHTVRRTNTGLNRRNMIDGAAGRSRGPPPTQRLHFRRSPDSARKQRPGSDASDAGIDGHDEDSNVPTWHKPVIENPAFDDYYKEQGIVSPEEWDTLIEFLRKPLPAAFRVSSCSPFCTEIRSQLETDFRKSLRSELFEEEEDSEVIRPLPWYPDNLAWQFNFCRKQLRKDEALERFHEFLKVENEIGNITRQEAVSMVPPLLLDIHPDHLVLDMCAAPGSKTYQLLELINQSKREGSLPDGLIVANDLVVQRCDHLIHKLKRMCTANMVVTNHEAQNFPGCIESRSSSATEVGSQLEEHPLHILFDRVLCDVPCSGDGTLRKAPNVWRRWNAGMGNGLHSLQLQIAMRGISLLKVGGRMVYSTCSMNPIENEAIVSEILRKCEGSVELVDISVELPQLVRRPGLVKWKVCDRNSWFSTYDDVPKLRRGGIVRSMFPYSGSCMEKSCNIDLVDGPQTVYNADEVSGFPLERCMRIVPQDQNGGAFFIAVFHKLAPFPAVYCRRSMGQQEKQFSQNGELQLQGESQSLGGEGTDGSGISSLDSKERTIQERKWKGVDPIVFLKDETIINTIKTFYGIDDSFPLDGRLVTRNSDANNCGKRIYYVSKSAKDLLESNFQAGEQLKITYVGLMMFERKKWREGELQCPFRISSEGLPLIVPYITKQVLYASAVDFMHLLQRKSVRFGDFSDRGFGESAANLMRGGCVIVLSKEDSRSFQEDAVGDKSRRTAIGCWKGKASLNVMVSPLDCLELLHWLFPTAEAQLKEI